MQVNMRAKNGLGMGKALAALLIASLLFSFGCTEIISAFYPPPAPIEGQQNGSSAQLPDNYVETDNMPPPPPGA